VRIIQLNYQKGTNLGATNNSYAEHVTGTDIDSSIPFPARMVKGPTSISYNRRATT
jgi:hypothetical protein